MLVSPSGLPCESALKKVLELMRPSRAIRHFVYHYQIKPIREGSFRYRTFLPTRKINNVTSHPSFTSVFVSHYNNTMWISDNRLKIFVVVFAESSLHALLKLVMYEWKAMSFRSHSLCVFYCTSIVHKIMLSGYNFTGSDVVLHHVLWLPWFNL